MSIEHYENFPVASWLCPPAIRPAIGAIYHFARTADDIADEGHAPAVERLAMLDDLGAALRRAIVTGRPDGPWQKVLAPLTLAIARHNLPSKPLFDLLSAFTQDVGSPVYADRAELLDYCARSANPIGRLLLHLAQVDDHEAVHQSDAVCTSLQLINFWQDLSIDLSRGRNYVPQSDAVRFGLSTTHLQAGGDSDATRAMVRSLIEWSRDTMLAGAPLVHRLPGRMGWELRFIVQGGLRILERIEGNRYNAMTTRPTIGKADAPAMAWRALRMRRAHAATQHTPAAQDGHGS